MKKMIATLACSVGALAVAAPAWAQDGAPAATSPEAQADAEGEIVVTAQRRSERVTKVPISITVADQAQLERQQVNNLNDLNRIAPALEIQQAPAQNTGGGGAIRGIGTQSFSPGATASVGVVVDQVSQGNANIADLFDVARIEVLKGPQGTLFGLTTSAGVINITTNAPDPSGYSARVRTELSDAGTLGSGYGQQIVQSVVNVPISADSAVRVSGMMNRRQGPNRNLATDDLNDVNRYAVRGRFLWNATSDLTLNVIGDWFKSTSQNGADFFTFISNTAANTALLGRCGVVPREGNRDYCIANEFASQVKGYGGSAQLDYDAGPFVLTSITAFRNTDSVSLGGNVYRADPIVAELRSGPTSGRIRLFTQEFRMASAPGGFLGYTAGAFFSRQRTVNEPERFSVTLRPAPGVRIPIVNTPGARNDVMDESLSVFGEATLNIAPVFRVIAGGRYTSGRLSLDRTDAATQARTGQVLNVDEISYRFGAQFDIDARTMAYATISRGFKGGQIATPTAPALPYVVLPEIPMNYEGGIKTTLFRGLVADLSVFYQEIANYQGQQCAVNPVTAQLICAQTNIDGVKSRGAEINLFGRVTRNLSLNGGFAYTKATYPSNFIGVDGRNLGGQQLAYAPRYKGTVSGEYTQPVTSNVNAFVAGDAIWKSRVRYQNSLVAAETFRPHWIVGGRIGVRTEDDRYSVAVFARNLFDVPEPAILQSNFGGGVGAIYGPQAFRQVGLQLDARF